MKTRPNILYIFTDQQSADAMSCAGNADVSTPAMDALAREGIRFIEAYCPFPICTPSRASMFTSLYPHELGIDENSQGWKLPDGALDMGTVFANAGYRTAYGGKWHLPEMSMPVGGSFEVISGIDDTNLSAACDRYLAETTEPFLLVASFDNPHNICEWTYDQDLPWGQVEEASSIAACPNLPANFAVPPFEPLAIRKFQTARSKMLAVDWLTPELWRRFRHAYYRLVEKVDAQIGRVLASLERHGHADNTLVVFASDHGEGAGSHQWRQKWTLYEESVKVPFIIRPPRADAGATVRLGATVTEPVSAGLDLMPTVCDYAGIAVPSWARGVSLRRHVERGASGAAAPRPLGAVFAETYFRDVDTQARMVRTERYKYVVHSWGLHREQLFDLVEDPGEMVNLAVEGRYATEMERHRDLLEDWCRETGDRFGVHYAHPRVAVNLPGRAYR